MGAGPGESMGFDVGGHGRKRGRAGQGLGMRPNLKESKPFDIEGIVLRISVLSLNLLASPAPRDWATPLSSTTRRTKGPSSATNGTDQAAHTNSKGVRLRYLRSNPSYSCARPFCWGGKWRSISLLLSLDFG